MILKLFEPIKINDIVIKNRIVMPSLSLGYCEDGKVTDRLIDFYVERARGGVGLICIASCFNDFGFSSPGVVALDNNRFLPEIRRLCDALHSYNVKVFAQILHLGSSASSIALGHQPVSASAVRSQLTREVPRELTIPEIKETFEHFAEGAWRAKEGGFDGVEVCGGGYLISQFLSPLTNMRSDEYGGDLKKRVRFPIELIQTIRERVGSSFPVSLRMSGDEFMRGGNTHREMKIVAKEMESAGVDVISVVAGWHQSYLPLVTMAVPRATFVYLAQGIKEEVDVPVIACNRINDPMLGERILLDGQADMISMGRALIADPELPMKAKEGRLDEIRTCIACNQGCLDSIFTRRFVSCTLNPVAGREREFTLRPVEKPKKVVVVGGGPSGMEVARVMRLRGYEVILYEKEQKLGGQLNLAAIPPGREEFATAVNYFSNEILRLGVKVELGKEFIPDLLATEKPDAIVVATGSVPIHPDIPGINGENVVYAPEVLEGKVATGKRVVVVGGGAIGAETALFLAKRGSTNYDSALYLMSKGAVDSEAVIRLTTKGTKKVSILEMTDKIGLNIGRTTRWVVLQDLRSHNVEMITEAEITRITERGVIYRQNDEEKLVEADTVVIAVGSQANDNLFQTLKGLHSEVYPIGDCIEPRTALEAIYEGAKIARQI